MDDMDVVHPRCAGMDISKDDAKVCIRVQEDGKRVQQSVTVFGATTNEILRLREALETARVSAVIVEATGNYWKPFFYVLAETLNIELVNAKQARNIPGRKSDMSDAAWLAKLGAHGLLRASFVPPEPQRQLRDLTRTRKHLVEERNRELNRIDQVLQDAGIKLSSVASKMTTVTTRRILEAMVAGERNPATLAELALGRARKKTPQLLEALTGRFGDHHAFMVKLHYTRIDELDTAIGSIETRIDEVIGPFQGPRDALTTIPGISDTVANAIIAEIGTDMSVFETAAHLTSWAGVCPGQNESAGHVKSSHTRPGNRYVKANLGIAVLAIEHTDSYLAARYRRIRARRGKQRAVVAIQRTLLVIIWNMLTTGTTYEELGPDYYQRRIHPERTLNRALREIRNLGYEVEITPATAA